MRWFSSAQRPCEARLADRTGCWTAAGGHLQAPDLRHGGAWQHVVSCSAQVTATQRSVSLLNVFGRPVEVGSEGSSDILPDLLLSLCSSAPGVLRRLAFLGPVHFFLLP